MPRTHAARRLAASLLVVGAMLVAAPGALAAADDSVGFGVAPLKFDIDVSPGQSSTHRIKITNTDTVRTTYTFSKEDFEGDKDDPAATPVLMGGKFASAISGYDWISAPDAITIPAGQSRTVSVRVNAPAGATGGHYAALVVSGGSRSAGNLVARSRLGVLFLMNAGGVPPPEIKITEIREVGPTKTVTKIRFVNDGQVATRPKPVVTVTDRVTGDEVSRGTGTCSTALPGAAGECTVDDRTGTLVGRDGGEVGSGVTQKSISLFGDDEGTSAKVELPTEWAGAWTSMILPLVGMALFALYFLFLRRRRKDEEAHGDVAFGAPLS